ncbi:MAG: hypothetical protein PHW90_01620, partial [Bacilli bacterium]|nr:hypothetical protein [Bacilli bacterium]
MKSKEKIRNWLLKNCVDEDGDLVLTELDFSDFEGNVYICSMKVKGDLYQHNQQVGKDLWQYNQRIKRNLWQNNQQVRKDLWQDNQKVVGNL